MITLEKAKELFQEAEDFYSDKTHFASEELRELAIGMFGRASRMQLEIACAEIFRVIAKDVMK